MKACLYREGKTTTACPGSWQLEPKKDGLKNKKKNKLQPKLRRASNPVPLASVCGLFGALMPPGTYPSIDLNNHAGYPGTPEYIPVETLPLKQTIVLPQYYTPSQHDKPRYHAVMAPRVNMIIVTSQYDHPRYHPLSWPHVPRCHAPTCQHDIIVIWRCDHPRYHCDCHGPTCQVATSRGVCVLRLVACTLWGGTQVPTIYHSVPKHVRFLCVNI